MTRNWATKPLGDVCDILDRLRKPITKRDRISGPYPYYGATGVLDHVADYIFDEPLVLIGEDGAKWEVGENSAFSIEWQDLGQQPRPCYSTSSKRTSRRLVDLFSERFRSYAFRLRHDRPQVESGSAERNTNPHSFTGGTTADRCGSGRGLRGSGPRPRSRRSQSPRRPRVYSTEPSTVPVSGIYRRHSTQ